MLIELIAAFAAGICGAGGALILRRIIPSLPKALIPIAAGGAMIGYAIWSEYSWFSRSVAALPESMEVLAQYESRSPLRPWTLLFPFTDRFSAVDMAQLRHNENAPGQVMAKVYLAGRYTGNALVPVLVDCPAARRADLSDGMSFDAEGRIAGAEWSVMAEDDPLLKALCF